MREISQAYTENTKRWATGFQSKKCIAEEIGYGAGREKRGLPGSRRSGCKSHKNSHPFILSHVRKNTKKNTLHHIESICMLTRFSFAFLPSLPRCYLCTALSPMPMPTQPSQFDADWNFTLCTVFASSALLPRLKISSTALCF
ncbi:hypothetical protein CIPAW_14G112400 [Carya illinoinensis]|uniref:Uncharacterized protein n=1 Tax=Carya illinoinensis TaxID=32201 RepID=A0A8T1NDU5_CARIL|nr:hypothetical protein CIPAW_14G112400 [Carya illinoinensis]